jgi:hypothetical protein
VAFRSSASVKREPKAMNPEGKTIATERINQTAVSEGTNRCCCILI